MHKMFKKKGGKKWSTQFLRAQDDVFKLLKDMQFTVM